VFSTLSLLQNTASSKQIERLASATDRHVFVFKEYIDQQAAIGPCLLRSSAVAERPRDASYLSVVSFNSTIPRTQSSIISYFGFRFTNTYKSIVLYSLCRSRPCCTAVINNHPHAWRSAP